MISNMGVRVGAFPKTFKSKQLVAEVKTINYWLDGARRALYNSKFLSQDCDGTTDDERAVRRRIRNGVTDTLYKANSTIEKEFAPEIGKRIIAEQT